MRAAILAGPANAASIGYCWSSSMPMSSANGSSVRSWSAVGSPVSQSVMTGILSRVGEDAPVRWVVVVPVKPAADGKTRLAGALSAASRERLVRAMALDTIAAAAAADGVDAGGGRDGRRRRCGSCSRVRGPGGRSRRRPQRGRARGHRPRAPAGPGVAVLLGDLPALRPSDLADALSMAAAHDRALVADADGTGTTVLTALPGVALDPRFGAGSAAAHERAGHVRLAVPGRVDRAARRRRGRRPGGGPAARRRTRDARRAGPRPRPRGLASARAPLPVSPLRERRLHRDHGVRRLRPADGAAPADAHHAARHPSRAPTSTARGGSRARTGAGAATGWPPRDSGSGRCVACRLIRTRPEQRRHPRAGEAGDRVGRRAPAARAAGRPRAARRALVRASRAASGSTCSRRVPTAPA